MNLNFSRYVSARNQGKKSSASPGESRVKIVLVLDILQKSIAIVTARLSC